MCNKVRQKIVYCCKQKLPVGQHQCAISIVGLYLLNLVKVKPNAIEKVASYFFGRAENVKKTNKQGLLHRS